LGTERTSEARTVAFVEVVVTALESSRVSCNPDTSGDNDNARSSEFTEQGSR